LRVFQKKVRLYENIELLINITISLKMM
jgi:hypothetical protein